MSITTGIIIGVFILAVRIIYHKVKNRGMTTDDKIESYALSSDEIIGIKNLLKDEKYQAAETKIEALEINDLTILADVVGLALVEDDFKAWLKESQNLDIPNLLLGVHYDFVGWKARSHSRASEVDEEGFDLFHSYQEKAMEQMYNIDESGKFGIEAHSRLIGLCKTLGRIEDAMTHFEKAIAINENHISSYLSYAEMIQPKWGGNYDLIDDLLKRLPENRIIQKSVWLKLTLDAALFEDNYFGGTLEELYDFRKKLHTSTHKEFTQNPLKTIHKYVPYMFMLQLSDQLEDEKLVQSYYELIKGTRTRHANGVILD